MSDETHVAGQANVDEPAKGTEKAAPEVETPGAAAPKVSPADSKALSDPKVDPAQDPSVVTDAPTLASLQAEIKAMKAEKEQRELEDAVMDKVDPAKAKMAKAILAGLDLGKGGPKARIAAATKAFETDFPELLKTAEGDKKTPAEKATNPAGRYPDPPPQSAADTKVADPLTNRKGVRLF